MTSNGCFAYITLPGQVEPVVAGRYEFSSRRGVPLGRFVYAKSYIARQEAVTIDPIDLNALGDGTYQRAEEPVLFPALRDASPDAWGRRVIDRALGGISDEVGYLLNSPDDRAGALGFGLNPTPPAPLRQFNQTLQLGALMTASDALATGEKPDDAQLATQVEQLHLLGTSMGGARPKAVIEDDDGLWLAKFSRTDDKFDQPRVEHAMLRLGAMAGLHVASSKTVTVAGRPVLMVKRFDREKANRGYYRHRMISGLTVLQASESATDRSRWSYPLLSDQLRKLDADEKASRLELFRRVVFNALVHNSDDHPRNHALIADQNGWRLSPAYDLTPTPTVSLFDRSLAMTIGTKGRVATVENLLSQSGVFGVAEEQGRALIGEMQEIVASSWYGVCREAGVSEVDCEFIASAFDHSGFDVDNTLRPDEPAATFGLS